MKDAKFIELLNLYLDHHLDPAEAAELEAEIQRNPARRRTYRQYCQMQKACNVLAADFRAQAPAQAPVLARPATRRRAPAAWYATGMLAAAACVAFLVVSRPGLDQATPLAEVTPAPVVVQAPAPVAPLLSMPAVERNETELRTAFTAQALASLNEPASTEALFADAARARYDWMQAVQLTPVQLEQLRFETANPVESAGHRTFRSGRPLQGNVEMTAFQFQK